MANKAEDKKRSPSVKSILGGDILANDFFRRQTKLLILMMIFILFYIHNRYASQQQQIEIDKLNLSKTAKITVVGNAENLKWIMKEGKTVVQIPEKLAKKIPHSYAYVLKITK